MLTYVSLKQLLLIGFGGFIGSIARHLMAKLNFEWHVLSIPVGTLAVNILGSLIIGLLAAIAAKSNIISTELRLFLMVGICGGFTTFSSFMLENLTLIQNGLIASSLIYMFLSLALGLLVVYLGYYVGSQLL